MRDGKWGSTEHYRYCWTAGEAGSCSRMLISVPKKFFKRAVKRNLLKRRTRESYRCNKGLLAGKALDIMFIYSSPELAEYGKLKDEVVSILEKLAR